MTEQYSNEELFYKSLLQYKFNDGDLDYAALEKHKVVLQTLSKIGNSGINVFDFNRRQIVFYSSNFGQLLGYVPTDYKENGQQFFCNKIHKEDMVKLNIYNVSLFKTLNNLSSTF